mmetsp:Transcript_49719/g.140160  ORF Transcript_49719/g.140160 Transcript_49719/m.140160 type:complete len:282 (-) Transcript_49719:321-1166(-)
MPLRLSCVSHAFFSVSMSAVSACATLSMSGQSWSGSSSHSILPSSSLASGSNPCVIGFTISPGDVLMSSCLPSRCVSSSSKPHSASTSEMSRWTNRSAPFRRSSAWSACFSTKTTSPVSASGCSSAMLWKTTLWPSGEPFWMWTSRISRSCFLEKDFPFPPHALHADCICWTIGPIRTTSTFTPRPSQWPQVWTPFFLSMTCRVIAIFFVAPLYICSSETFSVCTTSLVFWRVLPPGPPRRPGPPKREPKMSAGSPPWSPSRPSSPNRLYFSRFSGSLSTS